MGVVCAGSGSVQENPTLGIPMANLIDHFKLDIGAADAYMTLELPVLHRMWVKKQLKEMKYVVDNLDVEEGLAA